MNVHKSITQDRLLAAVESEMFGMENPGFCVKCGEDAMNCEPDAEKYPFEACGERTVYGAEQLMFLTIA